MQLKYNETIKDHIGNLYDIVPGDANASILLYRMKTKAPGERMPELGRSLVHEEGVALIQQWINDMKTNKP